MRVLFIGDIYGSSGRSAVHELVPKLRAEHELDVVVANCENAAAGKGVTPELASGFLEGGVDILTGGNHIWRYKEIVPFIKENSRLIRPANYPKAPGAGATVHTLESGRTLGVIQVEGRVFMRNLDCPFMVVDRLVEEMQDVNAIIVDFHAEATSEKQALGWHLDGRVAGVFGTHTHVQTADERILPQGTAFITDAGMTGPYDSVIGMKTTNAIEGFRTQRRFRHEVAKGNTWLCGVVVHIDDRSGKATAIKRIKEVMHG